MSTTPDVPSPTPALRRARTRMTGTERRQQLLDVGRTLFAEKGYDAASVEELAQRADVSKPVVYEHFGGKEGIYAVIVDREVQHLTTLLTAAIEVGGHPRTIVERTALALLGYIETSPDGFRILLGESPAQRGAGMYSGLLGDVAVEVERLLARHFERRHYESAWAAVYAQMLVGLVAQVGQWWLDDRVLTKEQVATHVVNLTWNGLVALERHPQAPSGEGGDGAGGEGVDEASNGAAEPPATS